MWNLLEKKENVFSRWCESKEIDDYEKLRQLILMEEFKQCVLKEIKLHLEEVKVDVLDKAAVVADDYALTHKVIFSKKNGHAAKGSSNTEDKVKKNDKSSEKIFFLIRTSLVIGHMVLRMLPILTVRKEDTMYLNVSK